MTAMMDFTVALLDAVAMFLNAEPIIYLFAVILLCFLCKAVKILMSP